MSQPTKDNRIIIEGEELRRKLLEGAEAVYRTVTTTFGPKGRNVLLEKPFGRALPTRDGVTVARDTYFSDRPKNIGAGLLLEASETTNRIAGDGTTATVALGYHLLMQGSQAIAAGVHPMEVKHQLENDEHVLQRKLQTLSKPLKRNQLRQVATVSSGDQLLGELISGAVERVGPDGGIITEKAPINDIEREYVDGYYLQMGFQALQAGKKELTDPMVIVSSRRLSSSADAVELLTMAAKAANLQPGNIPRLLLIGNIEDAAYNLIVDNINRGTIDAVIIKTPPQFGDMGKLLLDDIAIYAGCEALTDSVSLKAFGERYLGVVDRVVASKSEATIFADNATEAVQVRVAELKDQIRDEAVDAISEKLRDRVAKLEGKIALFHIGGATDSIKEEVEFRVEDALQASRAAVREGVVPGGGTTLLELSKDEDAISAPFKVALRATFQKLLTNANLPAELKMAEALAAPRGMGFNLRSDNAELTDVVREGVIDPTLVISEVIKNATAAAITALTTEVLLVFEDKKED